MSNPLYLDLRLYLLLVEDKSNEERIERGNLDKIGMCLYNTM